MSFDRQLGRPGHGTRIDRQAHDLGGLVAGLRRRISDQRRIASEAAESARQAEAAGRSGRVFEERSCVAQAEREIVRLEAELAELTRDDDYAQAQGDPTRSVH